MTAKLLWSSAVRSAPRFELGARSSVGLLLYCTALLDGKSHSWCLGIVCKMDLLFKIQELFGLVLLQQNARDCTGL